MTKMRLQDVQDFREKAEKYIRLFDEALKKNKKKWMEDDLRKALAYYAIMGNKANLGKPADILDNAESLIEKWWKEKLKKELKVMHPKVLYSQWANYYDAYPNLAFFVEEKYTKKSFNYRNKDILDLGCGTGRYSIPLAKHNNVTAVDFTQKMMALAKQKAKKQNVKIDFKIADITKYKPNKKYDVILSMLVLDHVKELDKVADVINSASKLGTEVIISNISPSNVYEAVCKHQGKMLITDTNLVQQYYHPLEEYLKLMQKRGFELIECKDFNFESKYAKIKKLEKFLRMLYKPVTVLYRFKKVKE